MKSASNKKDYVSTAVPKHSITIKNLSTLDRIVLAGVVIWCCTMTYWLITAERHIDPIEYRDNISIELDNLA